MGDERSSVLQGLLDRYLAGDQDALRELVSRSYDRLERLSGGLLRSFPAVRSDPQSILHVAYQPLMKAVEATRPATLRAFLGLARHKLRQTLLDLAEHRQRAVQQAPAGSAAFDLTPGSQEGDPVPLALMTEFHHAVKALPEDQREVFEMHYYLDLTQAEVARVLELHPKQVSRLWIAALEAVARFLPGSV